MRMSTWLRRTFALAAVTVTGLILTITSTSIATAESATQVMASAAGYSGHFHYKKNKSQPSNSRLEWVYMRNNDAKPPRVAAGWRAGSGHGSQIRNSCAIGRGWLPNGWYDGVLHTNHFNGRLIKGTVWQLSDKRCPNGTLRTELFIHSEMTADGGQKCTAKPDDPFCWEGDRDYYSNGCIKLSPTDIKAADRISQRFGGPGYGNHRFRNLLYVTGG